MTIYRRTAEALSSEVGSDFVAIHVERGQCFGMEKVSAAIWRMLEQPLDQATLSARLVERYEVGPEECRAEVARFLDQLTAEGLVEAVG